MHYQEALARIPQRRLPSFWVGDVAGIGELWQKLARGSARTIATTPGGRPLHLVAYGDREKVTRHANYNSAVGARDLSAYMDKGTRAKPVILFLGPVHGHETEALTGLVNLIQVMETGFDLHGREQPELRALGEACRLLVVPAGNPDGTARFQPRTLHGMELRDIRFWGQGTWADGSFCDWPACKAQHPMRAENVGFLGCYFDDAGINPMHDEFLNPMGVEAPAVLGVAQEEGPDLAVSLHSHMRAPVLLRPAYVPIEAQAQVRPLAKLYYELLDREGLPHGKPFDPQPENGPHPAAFNLTSALHHISGATAFTFECPHGVRDEDACRVSLEQILDIQLLLYRAMMQYALKQKRGHDPL
jgi:hypothetical protein